MAVEPVEAAGMKAAAETVPPSGSSLSAGHWEDCILPVSHQDLQMVDLKESTLPLLSTFKNVFCMKACNLALADGYLADLLHQ